MATPFATPGNSAQTYETELWDQDSIERLAGEAVQVTECLSRRRAQDISGSEVPACEQQWFVLLNREGVRESVSVVEGRGMPGAPAVRSIGVRGNPRLFDGHRHNLYAQRFEQLVCPSRCRRLA